MRRQSGHYQEQIMLSMPTLVWTLLFFLVPTVVIFLYAFKPADIYGSVLEGWTFETIGNLFNKNLLIVYFRTVWMSLAATVICLLLALPVAYFLARTRPSVRSLLLLLIILPFWSSFIVRIYAWKLMLHPEGFFKQFLVFLHLADENAILLYHPITVIVATVYSFLPFAILPLYAAAAKFDFQLIEAALDLGLTNLKAFFKIFIPGIKAAIYTAILMVFIPSLGSYVIPDILGGPKTEMIGNKIVQRTFTERNLPEASALSALLALGVLVPVAIITTIQARIGKKKGMEGVSKL